jgi:ADP-dependent NAD(P)H-hydrate dehydratase / NAD(P)H-hydrate epimerase
MKSIFFNNEVLDAEKKIISNLNISSLVLMENAGANSANFIYDIYLKENFENIVILAGKGNNAGDGFVIARHLANKNIKSSVLLFYPEIELKGDALTNFNVIKNIGDKITILESDLIDEFFNKYCFTKTLFVDSVFGIGFKGELEDRIKQIFKKINKIEGKKVIAIDTVSGLKNHFENDEYLIADYTLTMGIKKFNSVFDIGREVSGKIVVMNIGIKSEEFDKYNLKSIYEIFEADVKNVIPKRGINSNKYTNGKLFIISGSAGFSGASYLSSLSALKSGCGAVILGLPESLNPVMEAKTTEVITLPLQETEEQSLSGFAYKKISEKIKWSNAVLIGPGIGRNEETLALVRRIVTESDCLMVIDADGIFAFKGHLDLLKKQNSKIIITPHYGEFSNLTGYTTEDIKKNIYEISVEFAKKYNVILVLKNSPTIITDGKSFYINSTGRENLATVGSGDVLSGIIAGILSQNKNSLKSSLAGVFIHGRCGDILFNKTGANSTIASELISEIQNVKMEISKD